MVCVFGVEDFVWLAKHPKLMANKMMPSFDYGVVDCMHELIFNRTHLGQVNHIWDLDGVRKPTTCELTFQLRHKTDLQLERIIIERFKCFKRFFEW
ncbi:hypothetical protein COOONC_25307 [Cooperia oncophora]